MQQAEDMAPHLFAVGLQIHMVVNALKVPCSMYNQAKVANSNSALEAKIDI